MRGGILKFRPVDAILKSSGVRKIVEFYAADRRIIQNGVYTRL